MSPEVRNWCMRWEALAATRSTSVRTLLAMPERVVEEFIEEVLRPRTDRHSFWITTDYC